MIANVKIEQDKENKHIHRVFVDGKQIKRITRLDFEINPCEVPVLTIETIGGVDFEGQAEVNFLKDPFTVQNACKILRDEIMKHEDLYRAFSASIYSALKDISEDTEIDEMPEIILSRMIGED